MAAISSPTRRFYLVRHADIPSEAKNFHILNLQEIRQPLGMPRTTRVPTPYWKQPFACGLPLLNGEPQLGVGLVASDNLEDAYSGGSYFMFSPRAMHLIQTIDEGAFEAKECETKTKGGKQIEKYWLSAIWRVVVEFDVEGSVLERVNEGVPDAPSSPDFRCIYELSKPDLGEDEHAFVISRWGSNRPVWDDVLVDAWIASGMTGLAFTPLQEPSDEEYEDTHGWLQSNHIYWDRKRGLVK